jgi:hypothetical protein
MKNRGKRTSAKPVVPLPLVESEGAAAKTDLEQYRQTRKKQARAEAFWAGRNRAARRSARAAA